MNEVVEMLNETIESLLKHEKIFENIAKLLKKMHGELEAQGFSKEQADLIVANFKLK